MLGFGEVRKSDESIAVSRMPVRIYIVIWTHLILFVLGSGCSHLEVQDTANATHSLQRSETMSPAVSEQKEIAWVAFLMEVLNPNSPFRRPTVTYAPNPVGVLIEIASHKANVVKASSRAFIKKGDHEGDDFIGREDALRLVSDVITNVPHYETPESGPLMWPLSIEKGKIVYVDKWPSLRFGVWLDPFEPLTEPKAQTPFDFDLKEYGPRDLSKFKDQELSAEERFALWMRFEKGT